MSFLLSLATKYFSKRCTIQERLKVQNILLQGPLAQFLAQPSGVGVEVGLSFDVVSPLRQHNWGCIC